MESKAEYEDVLSSIRRLVSEEVRTRPPLSEVKAEARGGLAGAPVEKLVLTPAQRVSPRPTAVPANTAGTVKAAEKPAEKPAAKSAPEAPLLLRPHQALTEAPAPDSKPAATAETPMAEAPTAKVGATEEADPFDYFEQVFGTDDWQRAPLADTRLVDLERTISELEAVVRDQGHEFEPDGSEEEGSSPEVEPLRSMPPRPKGGLFTGGHSRDLSEAPKAAEAVETAPEAAPAIESDVEQLPEPEETVAEPAGEDIPSFVRSAVAEAAAPLEVDDTMPDAGPEFAESEAAPVVTPKPDEDDAILIDEDALRQMVRDLVREELQGVLGERITRNVRKLVRSEIHRIVASQDID